MDEVHTGASVEDCAARHGLPADVLRSALAEPDLGNITTGAASRTSRATALLRRKLSHEQELELHALVRGHLPDDLGLQAVLWNRDALASLIEQRTGFALPQRTLTTYMERWGFAPEKPLRNMYRQQPVAMREWMRRDLVMRHAGPRRLCSARLVGQHAGEGPRSRPFGTGRTALDEPRAAHHVRADQSRAHAMARP
ncbi:MAG: winged helix-turn-helix domain-containing protein [Flavobacteriales bacterium]|nr:winged helix-turn-helix domain-containing protein [Flavobacteriales bacterium]